MNCNNYLIGNYCIDTYLNVLKFLMVFTKYNLNSCILLPDIVSNYTYSNLSLSLSVYPNRVCSVLFVFCSKTVVPSFCLV